MALILTTCVIEIPVLAKIFEFETISIAEYFVALALAFLIIPVVETVKFIQRKLSKNK